MMRKPFDPAENIPVGEYGACYGRRTDLRIFPRPISPRENALLYLRHEKPYWIPFWNMDLQLFRPRMHPDNAATHLIIDGEGPYEYESNKKRGWFDLEWEYVPEVGGATVHPGHPKVTDISQWERVIQMPDLDELEWEKSAQANHAFLHDTDRIREIGCLSGLWERLISLMDVDRAAIALIDEDEQEGVHRFFSALCDLYDDMIARYAKYYDLEILYMHDDWGTNRAPFFSLATCREMIVPYLKRIVDACHKNGLYFELHCCGQNEALVPAMIEAGVDVWCGQPLNDYAMLSEQYPDSCLSFGLYLPAVAEDAGEEEIGRIAREFVQTYRGRRVVLNAKGADERLIFKIYEEARKAFAED